MRDALGARGEAIFYVLMTAFHSEAGPIFRPQFLGDKWPTVDFIVELLGADAGVPFFFVQVRTTRAGFTSGKRRLKVGVPRQSLRRLGMLPAPTYVVGIDEIGEAGYLLSANGESPAPITSMPTVHPIDRRRREQLWREVYEYWKAREMTDFRSAFVDPEWR
jgi:hypothetical protein